jgi:hypothetical protein
VRADGAGAKVSPVNIVNNFPFVFPATEIIKLYASHWTKGNLMRADDQLEVHPVLFVGTGSREHRRRRVTC